MCGALAGYAKGLHYNTDSVLTALDRVLDSTDVFETQLRKGIFHHRVAFEKSLDPNRRFQEASWLFYKYRRFRVDSAMYYADQRVNLAKNYASPDSMTLALINKADGLKRFGRTDDAIAILRSLPHTPYLYNLAYYYDVFYSAVLAKSKTAVGAEEAETYKLMLFHYRDSLNYANRESIKSTLETNRAEMLKYEGKYKEALQLLLQIYDK